MRDVPEGGQSHAVDDVPKPLGIMVVWNSQGPMYSTIGYLGPPQFKVQGRYLLLGQLDRLVAFMGSCRIISSTAVCVLVPSQALIRRSLPRGCWEPEKIGTLLEARERSMRRALQF